MTILDILALSLAVFYSAYSVSNTVGPFSLFHRMRESDGFIGALAGCLICSSIWFAALFYILLLVVPYVVYVFAAAGMSVFLFRYTGGSNL